MIWPKLTGANMIDLIRNWRDLWNNHLVERMQSLEISAGPGIRIDKRPMGQIISALPQHGNAAHGKDISSGLFRVTLTEENLEISGGWVNRNGLDMSWYDGGRIDIEEGTLCICSEPVDKLGNWSPIRARITAVPTTFDSPIAKISIANQEILVEQYPVTVAVIFAAKRCPIAEL